MDPLAALADGLVGEAHDVEFRVPACNLDLNLDGARLKAQESYRGDMRDHLNSPRRR